LKWTANKNAETRVQIKHFHTDAVRGTSFRQRQKKIMVNDKPVVFVVPNSHPPQKNLTPRKGFRLQKVNWGDINVKVYGIATAIHLPSCTLPSSEDLLPPIQREPQNPRSIFLVNDQKPSHHPNPHLTPNPKPIGSYGWRVCDDRGDPAGLGRRPRGGLLTDRMARCQHVAGGGPGLFVLTRGSGLRRPTNKGF